MPRKPHGQTSSNFLCMFTTAVARSSSGSIAIRYVLPVLWITSCYHIMGRMVRHTFLNASIPKKFCPQVERPATSLHGLRPGAGEVCYLRLLCSDLRRPLRTVTGSILPAVYFFSTKWKCKWINLFNKSVSCPLI